jgi:hypothetical protein
MILGLLHLALLLLFWVPPATIGRLAALHLTQRLPRVLLVRVLLPLLVLGWAASWFLLLVASLPPYESRGPGDPQDAPAMLVMSLLVIASMIVLPGSAIACWVSFQRQARIGEARAAAS